MAELHIESIFCADRRMPLRPRTTIGRAEESDIFLPDQFLSRQHAEIQQADGGFILVDLGSTNGTYLNGERFSGERLLQHRDVIKVGETRITYLETPQTAVTPQSEDDPLGEMGAQYFAVNEFAGRTTERAVVVSDLVQHNRVLGVLSRATSALAGNDPLPVLFDRIVNVALDAIQAERAAILLMVPGAREPAIKAALSRGDAPPITGISTTIAHRVVEGKMALLLPDVAAEPTLGVRQSVVMSGTRSVLCAPLWFSATAAAPKVLGLLYLDSRGGTPAFTENDLLILTVLANVAASRIENGYLAEENLERQRFEEDMRVAAEIQANILPRVAPDVPGYQVAGVTRSCRTVGGDYYDFLLEGDRLHLALGDVSGKGTGAAMLMTALRAAVRAHWLEGSVADATEKVSRTFHQCVPHDKYATFFMARLDVAEGRMTYVNAGHNSPVLVRADGRRETLTEGGTIIGAFPASDYKEHVVEIRPGDALLIFSDGVSETWPHPDLAERKMAEMVIAYPGHSAEQVRSLIFSDMDRRSGLKPNDDQTLVVLRRLGAPR